MGIATWAQVERCEIQQKPYKGVCMFEAAIDGNRLRIALDYSDYIGEIERDALAESSAYFKMQCLRDGYAMTPAERRKFFAGGYVMGDCLLTRRLSRIRAASRAEPQRFQVYGRFGKDFAKEIRAAAIERLKSEPALGFEGGAKKVKYRKSVGDASHSKICIDLPGNGDFCFRLFDYLAVGAFIIAYPHRTTLPEPLVNGKHIVYTKPDLSDIVPLCLHYLNAPEERRVIQDAATDYFDRYCHYQQLGSWYVHAILNVLFEGK